jgi:hypothetical protein
VYSREPQDIQRILLVQVIKYNLTLTFLLSFAVLLTTKWDRHLEGKTPILRDLQNICADRGHNDMYWKLQTNGRWRDWVRKSKRKSWTDQSKAYSQLGYSEKPLWTLTLELRMKVKNVKQVQCGMEYLWEGGSEWGRLRWSNRVHQLHIHKEKRTVKPLVIVLSGTGKGWGREIEGAT